jgi:hypothetical protein
MPKVTGIYTDTQCCASMSLRFFSMGFTELFYETYIALPNKSYVGYDCCIGCTVCCVGKVFVFVPVTTREI